MKTKFLILLSISILATQLLSAQVRGVIYDGSTDEKIPLLGATVFWAGTNIGVTTDENGEFNIGLTQGYDQLVASYVGFAEDTLVVNSARKDIVFALKPTMLEEIIVTGQQRGNFSKFDSIGKTEMISFSGLTKMACCSLADSFENSATVTVGYSDAVSGVKQIRMLGLAGYYTQILEESRPVMSGLGISYALGYVPGMWLDGVHISKGVTSVISDHEAVAGHINMEIRQPDSEEKIFGNVYVDSHLMTEGNFAGAININDKLSTNLLAHYSISPMKMDSDNDGFADSPKGQKVAVSNRWQYLGDQFQVRGGIKYLYDERVGGQMDYDPKKPNPNIYGVDIDNESFNAYVKIAVPLGKYVYNAEEKIAERSNLAMIIDYNHYKTNSLYGHKILDGVQNSLYMNGMYSWNINSRHKLIGGVTGLFNVVDQKYDYPIGGSESSILHDMEEKEAGAYLEYTYNLPSHFSVTAGYRMDYNNYYGTLITPRLQAKWNIVENLVLRGSVGMGSRGTYLFTDNLWTLGTGRIAKFGKDAATATTTTIDAVDRLERSITFGGSLSYRFKLGNDDNASLSVDYFRTDFMNQVIIDQEFDATSIRYYNLDGQSYSNTYQIDFNWTPFTRFDVLATFRYNQTEVTLDRPDGTRKLVEKPLTDRFKGLINLQYATKFRRWVFDFTAQLNGPMRLPTQDGNLDDAKYSPIFPMLYAQVTYRHGSLSYYLGCENLLNYTQKNSIISPDDPFSTNFNSSLVWGPLVGTKFYFGIRTNF